MSRLINDEQLKHLLNGSEYYGTHAWDEFCGMISECDAVDAVQVVRCGECKEWESAKDPDDGGLCRALGFLRTVREWYCADGERKDDGDNH